MVVCRYLKISRFKQLLNYSLNNLREYGGNPPPGYPPWSPELHKGFKHEQYLPEN